MADKQPQDQDAAQEQAQVDNAKAESTGERPEPTPAPTDAPTGVADTPSGTTRSADGQTRVSAGEPLASANARQGMTANRLNNERGDTLVAAEARPMPVSGRLHAGEQKGFHYHFFGDDVMRTEYGRSLGYEFADRDGNASDYDKAAKMGGLVRMRTPMKDYLERKDRINRVITPQAERAARERFIQMGEGLNEDVQPFDATRSRQGPFSQVARRQGDGSFREEG